MFICRPGPGPLAAFQFTRYYSRLLLRRTVNEKEPGIKPARAEWRRYPATNESEILSVEIKIVVPEQCRPGHAAGFEIVEQRCALAAGECFGPARRPYSKLLKQ